MARRAIASGRRDRLDPPRSFTRGSDAFLARLVGRSRQIRDGARMLSSFLPPGCRRFGGGAESAPLALGEEPRGAEARATASRARRARARARKHVAGIGRARRRFDHAPVVEGRGWVCGKSEAHRRRALEKRRPSEEKTGAETALRPRFFPATVFSVDSGIDRLIARTGRPRGAESPPLIPTHAGVFRTGRFPSETPPPASARAFFRFRQGCLFRPRQCAPRGTEGPRARRRTEGDRSGLGISAVRARTGDAR